MVHVCPKVNTEVSLQDSFWSFKSGPLDAHKIGWIMSGAGACATTVICLVASYQHASHYHKPKVQRQIIRILWMPMVFSIISFFSYRFFRTYTYYELVIIVYEALVLMAFLALMLAYVGDSSDEQMAVMRSKDKRGLPFPFRWIRFRPSKPYFLHALNISVLQYAFLRPLISITGMICEHYNVLCAHLMAPYFAEIYLDAVDFVSISIALYGLAVLYVLVVDLLKDKRPVAKFLSIKLLVFFTYYQQFVFSALANQGIIAETAFWTTINIADGLNAMTTCLEMVLFSLLMWWAYPAREYKCMSREMERKTNPLWAFWQALNYWDFVQDAWRGFLFLLGYISHKPGTRSGAKSHNNKSQSNNGQQFDIDAAFNRSRPGDGRSVKGNANTHAIRRSPVIDEEKASRASSDSSWTMINHPHAVTPKASIFEEVKKVDVPIVPSVIVSRPASAARSARSRAASPAPTTSLPSIPEPAQSPNRHLKRPRPRQTSSTPNLGARRSSGPKARGVADKHRSVARPPSQARAPWVLDLPTTHKQAPLPSKSLPDQLSVESLPSVPSTGSSVPVISPLSLLKRDDWLGQARSHASAGSSLQSRLYETADESEDSKAGSTLAREETTTKMKETLAMPDSKARSRAPTKKASLP